MVMALPSWHTLRAVLLAQYPAVYFNASVTPLPQWQQTSITGYVWHYVPSTALLADTTPKLFVHSFEVYGHPEDRVWCVSGGANQGSVLLGPRRIIALLRWYLG